MLKFQNIIFFLLLSTLGAAVLSGCGVKPANVEAPAGFENTPFPRTYPPAAPEDIPGGSPGRYLPEGFSPDTPAPKQTPVP